MIDTCSSNIVLIGSRRIGFGKKEFCCRLVPDARTFKSQIRED